MISCTFVCLCHFVFSPTPFFLVWVFSSRSFCLLFHSLWVGWEGRESRRKKLLVWGLPSLHDLHRRAQLGILFGQLESGKMKREHLESWFVVHSGLSGTNKVKRIFIACLILLQQNLFPGCGWRTLCYPTGGL